MTEYVVCFLDAQLNVAFVCDDYISLRFTERFGAEGEFECVLAASCGYIPVADSYALCGSGRYYVIDRVERNSATGEVTVGGRGILALLGRRIVPIIQPFRRSVERLVCHLAQSYAADAFPAPLEVGGVGQGTDADIVVDAGNLLDRMKRLATTVSKGLRLTYSPSYSKFIFELYDEKDRRLRNTAGNVPLLLSERAGTVGAVSAVTDKSDYQNRVTVRGSAGKAGAYHTVTVSASDYTFRDGYDDAAEVIREGYVNSGIGVSLYTSEDENGAEVFDSDGFFSALRERGREQLALHRVRRSLTATLTGDGRDAQVGDVCTFFTEVSGVTSVLVTAKEYTVKDGRISCVAALEPYGPGN